MQDTTPPEVVFNASLPQTNTSAATASFSWKATDAVAVSHRCRLSLVARSGNLQGAVHAVLPTGPLPGPALTLGQWADCSAPMQLYWLLPGEDLHLYHSRLISKKHSI